MKQKTPKYQGFGVEKTPRQKYQEEASIARTAKKEGQIGNMDMWLAGMDWKDAHPKKLLKNKAKMVRLRLPRRARQRGSATRSSSASGDSNADSDGDGEPPRPQLLDQATLADFLGISKKTLQNQYSVAPYTLPPAIQIPGARGPRWTHAAIQEWLAERPQHTPKSIPVAPKRKVGRPRSALAGKGGAA